MLQIIHNPDGLSVKETAGVVGFGVALGLAGAVAANAVGPKPILDGRTNAHFLAMVGAGAALYTLGVFIGTKRPMGGYFGMG